MQTGKRQIISALGGKKLLGAAAALDLDQMIRKGLPVGSGRHVKEELGLTNSQFAETLGVSERTLSRMQKAKGPLPVTVSDRLFRAASIYAFACEVLEDKESATKWLHSPQKGLGGRVPLDMLQTEAGAREVEDLLGRIEHGVIS